MIPTGSGPGKLYGQAKVHKPDTPLRPIISMTGTPEYKLAKFLDNLIKPYIPDTYMINSTEQFLDKLKNSGINCDYTMVSFDAVSLFTNMPLHETIDLILQRIYDSEETCIPIIKRF